MIIRSADFVISNTTYKKCPAPDLPEYAFIGRSNVGKSSLINMLTGSTGLAKTSGKPGKTQLINHFLINKSWYLVDLPGYGFAKVSKGLKEEWSKFITDYLLFRKNLLCVFLLIDVRLEPQKIDLAFMEWLGTNQIPFVITFTKADKLKTQGLRDNITLYQQQLLQTWEELPQQFITSAETKKGREEILAYIEETNKIMGERKV